MNESGIWCRRRLTKENMLVLALSGILIMVIAIPTGKKKTDEISTKSGQTDNENVMLMLQGQENGLQEEALEQKLAEFLSCMEGAGRVKVMLTFSSSPEQIVEKDVPFVRSQTSEKDSTGGSRQMQEQRQEEGTVYITDPAGNRTPYVKKTYAAPVEGVTVLAEGGASPLVQKSITDAIVALFGVEPHKIKVAKMVTDPEASQQAVVQEE